VAVLEQGRLHAMLFVLLGRTAATELAIGAVAVRHSLDVVDRILLVAIIERRM